MQLRVGFELVYDCPQPTPMIMMLTVHHSRAADIVIPDQLVAKPNIEFKPYRDGFGNWCSRIVAPAGRFMVSSHAVVADTGLPDPVVPDARQWPVEALPDDALMFLLGSRYAETDCLSQAAWDLFGKTPEGWPRVQAICDYVHNHVAFGYEHARVTKSALETFNEGTGVCRDFTHLAVAFCRCMNIPARYCTGYLSDIGVPPPLSAMDFSAWFEAFLDGQWHMFDPRNNVPRIGRVLIARGRDAADVPISHTFGQNTLVGFTVWAEPTSSSAPV